MTSTSPSSKNSNESDIIDASILLRHVNVDDQGIYRCVIRPWTTDRSNNAEDELLEDNSKLSALTYHLELTGSLETFLLKNIDLFIHSFNLGPRLCQQSIGSLPCFSNMRTSSPTILDAYQTAFLQCVVHNPNRKNLFFLYQ